MNLLVVAATHLEIAPLLATNETADILIAGVGIPATIFHLQNKLSQKKYDLVIQAGIAGTFEENFAESEVFLVQEDTFADIGVDENGTFKTLFEMGFVNANEYPYTDGWLKNDHPIFKENLLPAAKAITVNKIISDRMQVEKLRDKFKPVIESMEGAAFHYVCLLQKVNFLQVRSVSNMVGERDKNKWKMKEAIEALNNELHKFV
ncbi:MAG: futalosine hydrolase [Bacteroidota bacterium]|nr:futalosine hydrolase [Bacteroidota bacterium]